jgi:hypothetical protein
MSERESRELSRREAVNLLGVGAGLGLLTALRERIALAAALPKSAADQQAVPIGAVVRTILKDVPPESITGVTLIHEHLSMRSSSDSLPLRFYQDVDLIG